MQSTAWDKWITAPKWDKWRRKELLSCSGGVRLTIMNAKSAIVGYGWRRSNTCNTMDARVVLFLIYSLTIWFRCERVLILQRRWFEVGRGADGWIWSKEGKRELTQPTEMKWKSKWETVKMCHEEKKYYEASQLCRNNAKIWTYGNSSLGMLEWRYDAHVEIRVAVCTKIFLYWVSSLVP